LTSKQHKYCARVYAVRQHAGCSPTGFSYSSSLALVFWTHSLLDFSLTGSLMATALPRPHSSSIFTRSPLAVVMYAVSRCDLYQWYRAGTLRLVRSTARNGKADLSSTERSTEKSATFWPMSQGLKTSNASRSVFRSLHAFLSTFFRHVSWWINGIFLAKHSLTARYGKTQGALGDGR